MPNSDKTHVVLVLDTSGSMEVRRVETESSIQDFIKQQRELPGQCTVSLIEFNTFVKERWSFVPLETVQGYKMKITGYTALYDAIGVAIESTGKQLAAMPEHDRPGLVTVVVLTDGAENVSQTFTQEKVREMVEHQTSQYSWKFMFLGTNQDAVLVGSSLGVDAAACGTYGEQNTSGGIRASSESLKRMRHMTMESKPVVNAYTQQERTEMQ